jgi:hypothetical protein
MLAQRQLAAGYAQQNQNMRRVPVAACADENGSVSVAVEGRELTGGRDLFIDILIGRVFANRDQPGFVFGNLEIEDRATIRGLHGRTDRSFRRSLEPPILLAVEVNQPQRFITLPVKNLSAAWPCDRMRAGKSDFEHRRCPALPGCDALQAARLAAPLKKKRAHAVSSDTRSFPLSPPVRNAIHFPVPKRRDVRQAQRRPVEEAESPVVRQQHERRRIEFPGLRQLAKLAEFQIQPENLTRPGAVACEQQKAMALRNRPIVIQRQVTGGGWIGEPIHLEFRGGIGVALPFRWKTLAFFEFGLDRG